MRIRASTPRLQLFFYRIRNLMARISPIETATEQSIVIRFPMTDVGDHGEPYAPSYSEFQ